MTESSGAGLEVIQVKYGERVVTRSSVFNDYEQYGLPDGNLDMDYNFWVIRDGSRIMLLDTGYDIPARDWLGEISVTPTPEGLELLGIDPAEVTMVVTSHFHYDHIGYLQLFTNAQIVSGQKEYDYWFGKWEAGALEGEFTTVDNLQPVKKALEDGRLRLISAATQVYPGITVYPVGGHCPGELVTRITARTGQFIMAVDAAHFYEQIEHEWPFFAFTDLHEMQEALAFMNALAKETGATIIPGHDARVRDKYPALAGPAGRIATQIS
ncbi:N-acyl homoserine lactonase family protein [Acidothermaceae bacterium B102]|nr:N-acyl homoserine lactonase family protein [Acidothermaceae bacterium B102]